MANVTNLQNLSHPGKVILARDMKGNGAPTTDTRLADDVEYPIGSRYFDLTAGTQYHKTAAATWEADVQS